jgi:hypothetical protein
MSETWEKREHKAAVTIYGGYLITGQPNGWVAMCWEEADADAIIAAHNANSGLVEALRVMRQMIDVAEHRAFKSGLFMSAATTRAMQETFTELRAALTALEQG